MKIVRKSPFPPRVEVAPRKEVLNPMQMEHVHMALRHTAVKGQQPPIAGPEFHFRSVRRQCVCECLLIRHQLTIIRGEQYIHAQALLVRHVGAAGGGKYGRYRSAFPS